ncbi:glycosyl transferase [Sporosarcina sp. P26b]|uniref:glycosyltransferase family 4 protein n=1 Tax=Sporosarcina sp. P26b TaxID=2048253 RepID=UPI000C165C16|nr:glycosyltransferase family 4 protein [Sporosarcina sp. P26b]PIC95680.1 glycosyl transferase [Sporosarcina sp. P26b]
MQVLFCHDGPIRVDEEQNYYGIAHNNEMFRRYFGIADRIATVIRLKKISENESKERLSQITITPFKVYELPNISSVKGVLFNKSKARKVIKNAVLESDYIVARLPSMSGFIAIDYAKKNNKPYLTEVVACPWDSFWNHSIRGKFMAPFMYFATKKRVKNSKFTVYVTNEFLQRRYPTKGRNINCSNVALKDFDDTVLEKRIREIEKKKTEDNFIIGTTAAVDVRYKGQQYIIKAIAKLKEEGYINFQYQIVGAGDQTYLKSIAKKYNVVEQIKFMGPMTHSRVFDWLKTIDLYSQPSRQEGLPRALIEAMSCGLPAFGANTAGIPELLEDKYIFSNTSSNTKEIVNILTSYTKQDMQIQAENNYNEAKRYTSSILEDRRKKFFEEFTDAYIIRE